VLKYVHNKHFKEARYVLIARCLATHAMVKMSVNAQFVISIIT